ncbi:hypothetical protein ZHAS_00006759 [Anopheles sinensis]|uniref:Uncharacterized protein n=1 Tax=Anopheles sinensis TaxID=74873 RepID=A0A084VM52_ANOSI|nr:hypothetical protein ZHAS_00006759 [Anopheles sinensis]
MSPICRSVEIGLARKTPAGWLASVPRHLSPDDRSGTPRQISSGTGSFNGGTNRKVAPQREVQIEQ